LGVRDYSIVNAKHLDAKRNSAICGACHAGRTPKSATDIDTLFDTGLTYRPGDVLEDHLNVLQRDTPSPSAHMPDLFANRFWADGSVRLSAYEYQGQQQSACAQNSELTCIRCHSMHSGDPKGMVPSHAPESLNAPCLRCHQDIKTNIQKHTQHAPESLGSSCIDCHMPKAVYGVMTIHRTHLIAKPNVALDLAAGKPNACLNCHAEQSPQWALHALQQRWPNTPKDQMLRRLDGADVNFSDGLVSLLAGDPVRQAVSAFELGQISQLPPSEGYARIPWLLAALQDDRPGVRRLAWHSLKDLDVHLKLNLTQALADFDYTGYAESRLAHTARMEAAFQGLDKSAWPVPKTETGLNAEYGLKADVKAQLLALGANAEKQVDIGE
jgi:hypothetical protein